MKIEVNEYYLNASGAIINIIKINKHENAFEDNFGKVYLTDGKDANYHIIKSDKDLIVHIPKALHYDLLKRIESYHTNDSYKRYCDKNLGK